MTVGLLVSCEKITIPVQTEIGTVFIKTYGLDVFTNRENPVIVFQET